MSHPATIGADTYEKADRNLPVVQPDKYFLDCSIKVVGNSQPLTCQIRVIVFQAIQRSDAENKGTIILQSSGLSMPETVHRHQQNPRRIEAIHADFGLFQNDQSNLLN